jgi:hypothetical protein
LDREAGQALNISSPQMLRRDPAGQERPRPAFAGRRLQWGRRALRRPSVLFDVDLGDVERPAEVDLGLGAGGGEHLHRVDLGGVVAEIDVGDDALRFRERGVDQGDQVLLGQPARRSRVVRVIGVSTLRAYDRCAAVRVDQDGRLVAVRPLEVDAPGAVAVRLER